MGPSEKPKWPPTWGEVVQEYRSEIILLEKQVLGLRAMVRDLKGNHPDSIDPSSVEDMTTWSVPNSSKGSQP